MVWKTPRRAATRGTTPSAGDAVRHQSPGGSSTRTSTRAVRPCKRTRTSWLAPTIASGGAHASTRIRDSDTIGATIPIDEQA